MLTKSLVVTLRELLLNLKEEVNRDLLPRTGICSEVYKRLIKAEVVEYRAHATVDEWMRNTWGRWSKYSGSDSFPIPAESCIGDQSDAAQNLAAYNYRNSYKWSGMYLKLRLELIDFLLEELEKEID